MAPNQTVESVPNYCHTVDDVINLPAAGLGSFHQTKHEVIRGTERQKTSKVIDFSMLQPPPEAREKRDGCPRLDPSSYEEPAGGLPPSNELGGMTRVLQGATDPITHFKGENVHWKHLERNRGKRIGYRNGQTWTWSQDPESLAQLDPKRTHDGGEKFAIGADGQRYFNMFGREDMLPPATKPYMKSDKPAKQTLILYNDKREMPSCLRAGEREEHRRPVHAYWQSDRIWGILRDEAYMKNIPYELTRDEVGVQRRLTQGERRSRCLQSSKLANSRCSQTREESFSSDDESIEWMNGPMLQRSQQKENAPPEQLEGNDKRYESQMEEPVSWKTGPWMQLEAASSMTPRNSVQGDRKEPTLSMTPRSISRATPRSMTPRSITPTSVNARSDRLKPLARSVPDFQPLRRDSASQMVTARGGATPRGGVTPRGGTTPRAEATTRGDATPRSMTPRSSANLSAAALSMTPQLIVRRGSASNASAAGASARPLKKSASEVNLPNNS